MNTTARIDSIQYLRGIAALAVAVAHIASLQPAVAPGQPGILPHSIGFWGVDIFFVISGFIIVYVTRDLAAGSQQAAVFMLKRLVRIVPAYWFFTLVMFLANRYHWFAEQPDQTSTATLVKSLLFMQPGFPLLFVGWTLTLEMFFYAAYALTVLHCRAAMRPFLVAIFFILLSLVPLLVEVKQRYLVFYTQAVLLEFVAGMIIAVAFEKRRLWLPANHARLLFLFGCGLLVLAAFNLPESDLVSQRALWWGVPAAMIVLAALHAGTFHSAFLHKLGDVSYSLYLCHMPCAYFVASLLKRHVDGHPGILWIFVLVTLLLTAVVSAISWWLLERWPQNALRRRLHAAK